MLRERRLISILVISALITISVLVGFILVAPEHTHELDEYNSLVADGDILNADEHEHLLEDFVSAFNTDPNSPIVCYRKNHRNFYMIIFVLVTALLFMMIFAFFKIRKLNVAVRKTNRELEQKSGELQYVLGELNSSIDYAKNIHSLVLPDRELKSNLPNSFVYHRSAHKIGGDFYWCSSYKDQIIIGVIDCTGHGVPGALLAMTAHSMIGECLATSEINSPRELLDLLNEKFNAWLSIGSGEFNDGMEIAFCFINKSTRMIQYSGAGIPLFLSSASGLDEVKAVSRGIGRNENQDLSFVNHEIALPKGAKVFLTTDGYPDQFGGDFNKKFGKKRLKDLFAKIANLDINEGAEIVKADFESWKGSYDQTDDVTIIGFQIEE